MTNIRERADTTPAERPRRRFAFLLSPTWIAVILAGLSFAGACFWLLSPWQFNRNSERTAQNAAIDASITAPAVPVTDLLTTSAQPAGDIAWRVVTATGEFDPTRQIQVRLRQDANGNPVSEVITPFRLTTGETLLVDRGYVSFVDVRNDVAIAQLPTGQVTITGRVQDEQTDPSNRPPVAVGNRIEAYAISADAITSAGGTTDPSEVFLQGYIQLTAESPGVLTPIELPQTDSGPFLSYALQWAAFGVIALIGLAVFIYREAADPRPPDDHVDAVPTDRSGNGGMSGSAGAEPERRRSRDGFDRSQLYDE